MPTLAQRQDGCFIVRHFYQDFSTWQITTDGIAYLERRSVREDARFSTDQFMHLWMNGWVYTGEYSGAAPGPVVIGDRDAPQSVRDAIHDFHSALWIRDLAVAWRSTSEFVDPQLIRAIQPGVVDEHVQQLTELAFQAFCDNVNRSGMLELQTWKLRDIRTIVSGVEYTATIGARTSSTGRTRTAEWDEAWTIGPSGWKIMWERSSSAFVTG